MIFLSLVCLDNVRVAGDVSKFFFYDVRVPGDVSKSGLS